TFLDRTHGSIREGRAAETERKKADKKTLHGKRNLPFRQILRREDKALHALAPSQRGHDSGHIRFRDPPIEKMVRLHENGDAGGTLIEATRSTNPRLQFGQTASFELCFKRLMHSVRSARRTGSPFVAIGAAIRTNKDISRTLRHGCTLAGAVGAVNVRRGKTGFLPREAALAPDVCVLNHSLHG
ncbi:MAG TPA: hypothetical protein VK474_05240, partial [Chthoniobacterales bacterium]|nr:hypothetical protein [Chthoniobacterales bacterium]